MTFSLRNPSRDYSSFLIVLRGSSLQWWHFIEQTCIVTTSLTVAELTNLLLPYIETTDSLLFTEVDPACVSYARGWLPKEAWDWLRGVAAKPLLNAGAGGHGGGT